MGIASSEIMGPAPQKVSSNRAVFDKQLILRASPAVANMSDNLKRNSDERRHSCHCHCIPTGTRVQNKACKELTTQKVDPPKKPADCASHGQALERVVCEICLREIHNTGERLQNQRPHPLVRIEDEEDAHEIDTGNGCSGGCDLLARERLPKQRPLGDEHPEHNSEEHLGAQVPHQVEEAGSIVFHSSSNASEFKNDNKEAQVTTSAAAKESEEFLDKDAEILRLIEERRSTPKEEKQRLKDLSKSIKNASEKKKNEETARHSKNP